MPSLPNHQPRVGGGRVLGIRVSLCAVNISKWSFAFPFYLLISTFFTLRGGFQGGRFPAHATTISTPAPGGLMGHRGENRTTRRAAHGLSVSNCKGSPPRVLILRHREPNVNTWPLREHSELSTEAGGNTTPTWSSERKACVICFKSPVKKEFFLSSFLWGEKKYRRVFGIHCLALALSSGPERRPRAPVPEWLTHSSVLKNKTCAHRRWGRSPRGALLILSSPQNLSTFQFSR